MDASHVLWFQPVPPLDARANHHSNLRFVTGERKEETMAVEDNKKKEKRNKKDNMMNIFVTGATGVLGKALVPRLVKAGYTVSAMSRTPENDDRLRRAGAHPVQVDLFDV